ncbi:DUF402 domain-containing protein [Streptomyces boninensis]|uniref:DUF402 domain-containing protein n=1 Tax=Streptomyces boninensis TaxID=2039455 RepID=UPI003B2230E4
MTEMVRAVYRKYDGSLHWNVTMRRLGEDAHGVWLGAPAHTPLCKGHDPVKPLPWAYVYLVPHDPEAWWSATFNAAPKSTEVYVDVTTPAQWRSAAEVSWVDLDLDVIRRRDKPGALLVDEDEFADHQVRYGYPPDVIDTAERTARWLVSEVAAARAPFTEAAYGRWLEQVA